jgi:hypothetical protein
VKKTRQNKEVEPRSDSIGTEKALAAAINRDVEQLCLEILNCSDGTQSTNRAFAAPYRKPRKRGLKPLEPESRRRVLWSNLSAP